MSAAGSSGIARQTKTLVCILMLAAAKAARNSTTQRAVWRNLAGLTQRSQIENRKIANAALAGTSTRLPDAAVCTAGIAKRPIKAQEAGTRNAHRK